MHKYDVSLDMTLTVELKEQEPTDEDIIQSYLNKMMSLIQNGELDSKHFSIEESE